MQLCTTKNKGTFPPNLNGLKVLQQLSGAQLVEWTHGGKKRKYVRKQGCSRPHLKKEAAANLLYDKCGAKVPPMAFYDDGKTSVQLTEYLPSTRPVRLKDASRVCKFFALDALFANWNVIGSEEDGILVRKDVPFRVENGGALRYRAQGGKKGDGFRNTVGEVDSMRCKGPFKPENCNYFRKLTDSQVARQIRSFIGAGKPMPNAATQLYNQGMIDASLLKTLKSRCKWLADWAKGARETAPSKRKKNGSKSAPL